MNIFCNDLGEIFKNTNKFFVGVHLFISISTIGYDFVRIYRCIDGCFQLSCKPQNFIQCCVIGRVTMTTGNEKEYIEGLLQDLDAVSWIDIFKKKKNNQTIYLSISSRFVSMQNI